VANGVLPQPGTCRGQVGVEEVLLERPVQPVAHVVAQRLGGAGQPGAFGEGLVSGGGPGQRFEAVGHQEAPPTGVGVR
jgi:hypothetical protein